MKNRIFCGILCMLLLCGLALPVFALDHGTSDTVITQDQVNNTPPMDYRVNPNTQAKVMAGLYNAYFPEDTLQTVSIQIEENNLNYLLQNAAEEPYVMTTSVTIGDTTLGYCGLRTKGNYTLYHSFHSNPGSDRFSFTVNFGKYVTKELFGENQNFYGCDRISFNNFFFDKSMMKEFFAFKLMEEMGLPIPQYGLAKLYINGEYYGVYFMVEAMDSTVLEQHWQVDKDTLSSYLCKITGSNLLYNQIEKDPSPLYEYSDETLAKVRDMLPVAVEWTRKLSNLSAGKDFDGNAIDVQSEAYLTLLAQVMDVEETVRYFAAHSWLCQMDNMFTEKQNFGLYISPQGVSTVIPWDYDLSFGCYYPSTAELTANYPVDVMYRIDAEQYDTAAASAEKFYTIYPLFHVIYQNERLRQQYHEAMLDCSRIAAMGGTVGEKNYAPGYFASFIDAVEKELVAAATEKVADNVYYMNHSRQPSDVKKALPNLKKIIALRAVGVWSQLAGDGLTVSASGCDLSTLGNAIYGDSSCYGELLIVNPGTCMYLSARFEGGKRGAIPNLVVETVENGTYFDAIAQQVTLSQDQRMTVYRLTAAGTVTSDYTLTVPMDPGYLDAPILFYSYGGNTLTELTMSQEENRFTCTLPKLGYLVVVTAAKTSQQVRQEQWIHDRQTLLIVLGAGLAAAVATALVIKKAHKR